MRHADPLNEFVARDDKLCTEIDIPIVDFDPRYVSYCIWSKIHEWTMFCNNLISLSVDDGFINNINKEKLRL